ncbi:MAG: hypothetical protein JXA06_02230 [Bacteroidetes bacterium]|nr:hypothetical protein [Bacteroidota bacterium]
MDQKGDIENGQKCHTVKTIVAKLRETDVMMAKGQTIEEIIRQLGISDATYYKLIQENPCQCVNSFLPSHQDFTPFYGLFKSYCILFY